MRLLVRAQRITHCAGRLLIHALGKKNDNESITNFIQFQALTNWVHKDLLPEAGTREVDYALEEARRKNPELTRVEAEEEIKRAQLGPRPGSENVRAQDEWQEISNAMDWNRVTMEEVAISQARDAAEIVKAALQNGIIKAADIELYRRPPPDAGAKLKRDYENRISELERELQRAYTRARELEAKLASAESRIPPPVPPRGLVITPSVEQAVINAYVSELMNHGVPEESARRYTLEHQLSLFAEVSPARDLDEAEKLAQEAAKSDYQSIRATNKPGVKQIVITRGQARRDYLLNEMLNRKLSKREQQELDDLEHGAPGSELEEELIEYPKPPYHIMATSGPYPVDYTNGFDLGAYDTYFDAEENLRFFEEKGFRGTIVEKD